MSGVKKCECPPCDVGDKLGCRVTFGDENQMTVSFFHNDKEVRSFVLMMMCNVIPVLQPLVSTVQ